ARVNDTANQAGFAREWSELQFISQLTRGMALNGTGDSMKIYDLLSNGYYIKGLDSS
ncbi:36662_t:CDS:2, partial [Racocetra persica]